MKLLGIRALHDFITVRHLITGTAIMKVQHCYMGTFQPGTIQVLSDAEPTVAAIPGTNMNYTESGRIKPLSVTKLDYLRQMCSNFIPGDRHLSFI